MTQKTETWISRGNEQLCTVVDRFHDLRSVRNGVKSGFFELLSSVLLGRLMQRMAIFRKCTA